jgi:TfoX/Sxy family transcriptional regulator of competence genes
VPERKVNMASDETFVKFITDQIENAGQIRYRKMFGEYAIYCNEKVVALVCDNQLFVKPTIAGRSFIGNVVEASPYKGAKPSFLIQDQFEDTEWLSELIALTENELPKTKKKKKRKKISKSTLQVFAGDHRTASYRAHFPSPETKRYLLNNEISNVHRRSW